MPRVFEGRATPTQPLNSDAPMPSPTSAAKGAPVTTYVVIGGLVVLMVGGLAWIIQYLPSRGNPQPGIKDKPAGEAKDVLVFSRTKAVWETDESGEDTGYMREYERGVEGNYYFPFR